MSAAAVLGFAAFDAQAGTLFYTGIPAADSDAASGLKPGVAYTGAVTGGIARDGGHVVNGVPLAPLTGSSNTCSAGGVTLSAASGVLNNGGGKTASIQADGALRDVFSSMIFNDGAADGSEQYIVLDPQSLTPGKTYDLRVYFCNASGQNRLVNLSFAGDGQAAVETDFFNEDDATTSAGGFSNPNQVYYVDYRYTWDGATTPGVTITQKFGLTPFCLYAVTNEEVPAGAAAPAPAPVAQVAASLPPRGGDGADEPDPDVIGEGPEDDVGVASDEFYSSDSLRSHGRWISVGSYGLCWQPQVDDDWRPYTRGRWVNSPDYGWVWDSDEDWGWATYHYGRWTQVDGAGWCWVPGRVWAPAWVSWRYGGAYVGWAPLPPEARFAAAIGISMWADAHYGVGPYAYNFCVVRDFGAPSLARVLVPPQLNVNVFKSTTNVTNIVNNNGRIYSGGPNVNAVNSIIAKSGGQPIPVVNINRQRTGAPLTAAAKSAALAGGVLAIAAPRVLASKPSAATPKAAATIAAAKIDHGWSQVKDPKVATALKASIAQETHGQTPQTAHAQLPRALAAKAGTAAAIPGAAQPAVTIAKPGQPLTSPRQAVAKPGAAIVKPGQPVAGPAPGIVKPGATIPKPGQPLTPTKPAVAQPGVTVKTHTPPVAAPKAETPAAPAPAPAVEKPAAVAQPPAAKVEEPVKPAPTPAPKVEKPGKHGRTPAPKVEKPVVPVVPVAPPAPKVEEPAKPVLPSAPKIEKPAKPVLPPAPKIEKPVKPVPPPAPKIEKPAAPVPPPAPKVEKPAPPAPAKAPEKKGDKGKPTPPPK